MKVATIFFVSLSGLVLLGLSGKKSCIYCVCLLFANSCLCLHGLQLPILLNILLFSSGLHLIPVHLVTNIVFLCINLVCVHPLKRQYLQ